MEQSVRRAPANQTDYYLYTEYLTEEQINKLVELDVYLYEQGKEPMYVFSEAQISRQQYYDKNKKDIPLSIIKLPRGFRWKELSMGDRNKTVFINISTKEIEGENDDIVCYICKHFQT